MSAERSAAVKRLPFTLLAMIAPAVIAIVIGRVAPLEGSGSLILSLVLVIPLVIGAAGTVQAVYEILRARSVIRRRIRRASEPADLASFVCPACKTQNQGPFLKSPPRCESCDSAVLGVKCWRCGTLQPQEAFDSEAPRKQYACTKCQQVQEMPLVKTEAWWR